MGFFTKKSKPQTINIEAEIDRISKYMWEYEDRLEMINDTKILISERDYNILSNRMSDVLSESSVNVTNDLNEQLKIIVAGQNLVSRIIDKLYDIEWVY